MTWSCMSNVSTSTTNEGPKSNISTRINEPVSPLRQVELVGIGKELQVKVTGTCIDSSQEESDIVTFLSQSFRLRTTQRHGEFR